MKRSDMVNLIHDYYWDNYPDFEASDLLTIIEKAGMLPPNQCPWDNVEVIYSEDGSTMTHKATYKGNPVKLSNPIHEWEEE